MKTACNILTTNQIARSIRKMFLLLFVINNFREDAGLPDIKPNF
jgi:hypothetical protein